MQWRACVFVACAACSFPPLPDIPLDGRPGDASGDAGACEGDRYGYRVSNVDACDIPVAAGPLTLTDVVRIDTFAGTMTARSGSQAALPGTAVVSQAGGPMLRIVAATSLVLPEADNIEVVGDYPLMFAVRGNADISGKLLVTAGPRRACTNGSGSAGTGAGLGGGGGGGSLGATGGAGGTGSNIAGTGGAAGTPSTPVQLNPLAGGCAGSAGNGGSTPGSGGGGLQISASGSVTISGEIDLPGGGGAGGGTSGGGAGGGAGGMLVIEASNRIDATGTLTANGGAGGGGGGGGGTPAGAGLSGRAGQSPAIGGNPGATGAGFGGNGGAGASAAVAGGNGSLAGGGGGGSVGMIWLRANNIDVASATLSPSPRTVSLQRGSP